LRAAPYKKSAVQDMINGELDPTKSFLAIPLVVAERDGILALPLALAHGHF